MLKDKVALVTGSTSGIGLGIAKALAHVGVKVMLNGLGDLDDIEVLRAGLERESGVKIGFHGANLMNVDEIEDLIAQTQEQLGEIDILVNSAGIQFVSTIEDFPLEKWDAIIAINLTAAFHTTRLALPSMKARKWGRVINIASAHSLVASPFKSAYVAAKHGMAGLTKTAALEVARDGVTVNAISPGYVLTPLVEAQIPDTAQARGITEEEVKRDVLLAAQPTKEFVTTEQIADLCLFLCGPSSGSVNGANMSMDGGWTSQ